MLIIMIESVHILRRLHLWLCGLENKNMCSQEKIFTCWQWFHPTFKHSSGTIGNQLEFSWKLFRHIGLLHGQATDDNQSGNVKELLIFNLCFGLRIGLRMGHSITAGLHSLSYQQYSVLNVESWNSIFEYLKSKAARYSSEADFALASEHWLPWTCFRRGALQQW